MQNSLDGAICFYILREGSVSVMARIGGFRTDVTVQSCSIWTSHASVDRNKNALGWDCANHHDVFRQTTYVINVVLSSLIVSGSGLSGESLWCLLRSYRQQFQRRWTLIQVKWTTKYRIKWQLFTFHLSASTDKAFQLVINFTWQIVQTASPQYSRESKWADRQQNSSKHSDWNIPCW